MSQEPFAQLHPGVQQAIWKMGWKALKAIQVQAIQTICGTEKHLVICAPTAGGKTEAAFLPMISQLADTPQPSAPRAGWCWFRETHRCGGDSRGRGRAIPATVTKFARCAPERITRWRSPGTVQIGRGHVRTPV